MIGAPQTSSLVTATKNFISDQTWDGFTSKYGAAAFNVTKGLGSTAAASTTVIANVGGFGAQKITAVLRYVAATAAGAEDIGILGRYGCFDVSSNWGYYVRQYHGSIYLQKVAGGVFTTLQSTPFPLPVDTDMTIVLTCLGTSISAVISTTSLGPVTLSGIDATFTTGGAAFTSQSPSTIYCSRFDVEQLQ